jgi:hypothetical protein
MWYLAEQEHARMLGISSAASDSALVHVDDELARYTGYEPVRKMTGGGGLWLFQDLPNLLDESFVDFKVNGQHNFVPTHELHTPPLV